MTSDNPQLRAPDFSPCFHDGGGDIKHFPHARTAGGAFVPDYDEAPRFYRLCLDGGKAFFLAFEDFGRTSELEALVTRELSNATVRSQIPAKYADSAARLYRRIYRSNYLLAGSRVSSFSDCSQRSTVDIA